MSYSPFLCSVAGIVATVPVFFSGVMCSCRGSAIIVQELCEVTVAVQSFPNILAIIINKCTATTQLPASLPPMTFSKVALGRSVRCRRCSVVPVGRAVAREWCARAVVRSACVGGTVLRVLMSQHYPHTLLSSPSNLVWFGKDS